MLASEVETWGVREGSRRWSRKGCLAENTNLGIWKGKQSAFFSCHPFSALH